MNQITTAIVVSLFTGNTLANLQALTAAQHPPNPESSLVRLTPLGANQPGFTLLDPLHTGVLFTNQLDNVRSAGNRNLLSGSGVAAADVDGDGLCDLYFCALDNANQLYRNLGNWKFEDITTSAGVACAGQDSTGCVFADVDGDGDPDLLVSSLGNGVRLFLNQGRGTFTETTQTSGLASRFGSMSMALADLEGDGDLDLYVANYRPTTIRDRPSTRFRFQMLNGQPVVVSVDGRPATEPDLTNRFTLSPSGEVIEASEPSDLFLNDGHGRFTRASFTDGRFLDENGQPLKSAPHDWSLSVRFFDWTGDGAPDLYICNDLHSEDGIWVNDGAGRFRALPRLALRHTSTFSMGMDFGDLNRDGAGDFLIVDMVSRDLQSRKIQIAGLSPNFSLPGVIDDRPQYFQNTLFVSRGDGTFAELACFAGLEATEWSWHPVLLDVDLDGFEDVLIPNGMLRDFQNADLGQRVENAVTERRVSMNELARLFEQTPALRLPNLAFRNRGNLTFEEHGQAWGFATPVIAQGLALADLDNDGDLDIAINNFQTVAGLYRNDTPAPRLAVRLRGLPPNTQGIGARLRIRGGPVEQTHEMVQGGRYLSDDDELRVFAAGDTNRLLTVEVTWRSGVLTVISNVPANSLCEIKESRTSAPRPSSPPPTDPPWFEDMSDRLRHVHHDLPFDELSRQPLLPRMYSHAGPGVTWTDLDANGTDDLVVGTGPGGRIAAFLGDGRGGFQPTSRPPFDSVFERDTTALLGPIPLAGQPVLLAGSSNYRDGAEVGTLVKTLELSTGRVSDRFPGQAGSTGPLSLADLDQDGDLDLFVGGRTLPGRIPEPASSMIFRNTGSGFEYDRTNAPTFAHLGLVNASLFSDLDHDGDPDLVLACDWGLIRVFTNEGARFREVTRELGLETYRGWWQSVAAGDFDGDGRMDLVAGNWGLNTPYRVSPQHPHRLYHGDFSGSGQIDLIETIHDPQLNRHAPLRDLRVLSMAMPRLNERFTSHEAFARATVEDLLGDRAATAHHLETTCLESMLFLNRGNRFEPRPLPSEAQWTPVTAVCVADFDGDGCEDLFLGQNFFQNHPILPRYDAGEGLCLRGNGQGGFTALPPPRSGIRIQGEQKGAAVADFDRDGRVDLAVGQNSRETRLFRNTKAAPGIRVRLTGPPGNPHAIGAILRLRTQNGLGPARELHAGTGFWSQDSPVTVLARTPGAQAAQVRWPGGRTSTHPLPVDQTELHVRSP